MDPDRSELAHRQLEWQQAPGSATAGDLLSVAAVLGSNRVVREAADAILADPEAPRSARELAIRLLGREQTNEDESVLPGSALWPRIRGAKDLLDLDPRNALRWAELARFYASLNQREHAERAMTTALALAPDSRFLLRAAARLNLHLGDPEKSHRLLERAGALRADPWLAAAEIAIAPLANKSSRLLKHGSRMLESGRFSPLSLSELASALGTEALESGKSKQARNLFRASMVEPTENAVAQTEWASRNGASVEFDPTVLETIPDSHEASAWFSAETGETEAALENAWAWMREQPFASAPPIFGSHAAAVAKRYDEAIKFGKAGLVANPTEFLLRNNLAFAHASKGETEEAERVLDELRSERLDRDENIVLLATRGLIEFRKGNASAGRALYQRSLDEATDPSVRAVAALILAREEIVAATGAERGAVDLALALVSEAKRLGIPSPRSGSIAGWLQQLDDVLGSED